VQKLVFKNKHCQLKANLFLYIFEKEGVILNVDTRWPLCGQYLWKEGLMGLRANMEAFEKRNIP